MSNLFKWVMWLTPIALQTALVRLFFSPFISMNSIFIWRLMETAFLITRLGALSLSHCIIGSLSWLCIFLVGEAKSEFMPECHWARSRQHLQSSWQWMDERANQNVKSEVKICFALSFSCKHALSLPANLSHSHTHTL